MLDLKTFLFSARKYQINPSGHRPGSPVSTDSNMSMAAVHRRPPKKQKQHPAGHPGNQRREAYNEGTFHLCKEAFQESTVNETYPCNIVLFFVFYFYSH